MKHHMETSYGIIGLGRFGSALAQTLADAGKEVIVVDKDESRVRELRSATEYAFVVDNLSTEALREIGIQNCGTVIICIGEKLDVSILTTMRVIELGVPRVISKALSAEQGTILSRLGAEVVYPERDMALRLGKKLVSNNFLDYVSLNNSVEIRQVQVPSALVGQSVEETKLRQKFKLNMIAIEHGQETNIEITPDYRLKKDDIMVVIGNIHNIDAFENQYQ